MYALDVLQRSDIGFHCVADLKDVAHLPAITVNNKRLALQRADEEVRDPALVLGTHLPLTVDAAHSEYRGRHTEAARIIEYILVGRALRAAVGRVEIEGSALIDPAPHGIRLWLVPAVQGGEL